MEFRPIDLAGAAYDRPGTWEKQIAVTRQIRLNAFDMNCVGH